MIPQHYPLFRLYRSALCRDYLALPFLHLFALPLFVLSALSPLPWRQLQRAHIFHAQLNFRAVFVQHFCGSNADCDLQMEMDHCIG